MELGHSDRMDLLTCGYLWVDWWELKGHIKLVSSKTNYRTEEFLVRRYVGAR